MALFSCRLLSFVISTVLLKCLADARTYYVDRGSSNRVLKSYLNEITETNMRAKILQQSKRELWRIQDKIDLIVDEIERAREESFNSEEIFWNPEKRYENELLRIAQRRLRKNRRKIGLLLRQIDEIERANNAKYKRSRARLLKSYNAEFITDYPIHGHNLNRVLVKRKVPRGVQSPKFEYSVALKSLYRPLLKIRSPSETKDYTRAGPDSLLQHPQPKENTASGVIDDIIHLLREGDEPPEDKQSPENTTPQALRDVGMETSGESDAYAPGKDTYDLKIKKKRPNQQTSTKPPFWLPKYSLFNFWTYHKSLWQDGCPENEIKLGNICIAAPPH